MKKALVIIACVALVGAFTSCNKKCTCKTYAAGVVTVTQEDVEIDKDKKCSDYTAIVSEDPKTGVECK